MAESQFTGFHATHPTHDLETTCNFTIDLALFRSNCAPSSSQTQEILKTIAHGKHHLQSLGEEIQRVRQTLADLERKQEKVKSYVTCQESLLSPIRRVPPEILGQIFLRLRDLSEPICYGDDALESIGLWALLRVCRFWRDVALSYSELWSEFGIIRQPFCRPSERDATTMLHQALQLTKDCISHSRTRPLHFVFHANEDFLAVGKLLAVESARWSSAAFNNLRILQALEPEIHDRLHNLRVLDLDALGKDWDSSARPLQAFSRAPSLERLSLNGFERPQGQIILPWLQITHFTSFELRRFLPILRFMPSLVEFKSIEDHCQQDEIQERILLPNLERLEVTSNSPTTSQIFDALKTPKLSSLHLISKRGFSRIYAAAVVQMIRWSGCDIEILSITDYASDSILRILGEVRDLKQLTITNLLYPSELLAGMNGLLPNLQSLVLQKCEADINLGTDLKQMMHERRQARESGNGRHSLTKICVGLSSTPRQRFHHSWKNGADSLRKMGVEIELRGPFDC